MSVNPSRRRSPDAPSPEAVPDLPKLEGPAELEIEKRRLAGVKQGFAERDEKLATEEETLDASLLALAGKKDAFVEVAQLRTRLADVQLERRGLREIHIPRADEALGKVTEKIGKLEAAALLAKRTADLDAIIQGGEKAWQRAYAALLTYLESISHAQAAFRVGFDQFDDVGGKRRVQKLNQVAEQLRNEAFARLKALRREDLSRLIF